MPRSQAGAPLPALRIVVLEGEDAVRAAGGAATPGALATGAAGASATGGASALGGSASNITFTWTDSGIGSNNVSVAPSGGSESGATQMAVTLR